jgi:hypothetical protein
MEVRLLLSGWVPISQAERLGVETGLCVDKSQNKSEILSQKLKI